MNKISICIIAFNSSKYVSRCLSSISTQTIAPYEVIFIDDNSNDDTYEVAKSYELILPQLKVCKLKSHSRVGKARNIAISKASGDYVWAVDCDDTIPCDALNIFLDALDKYNSDVIVGAVNIVSHAGKIIHKFVSSCEYYNIIPIEHPHISLYTSGYHVSMIIRKSLLIDNNINYEEDIVTSADGVFLFSLVRKIKKMTILKSPVYNYYIGNQGSTSKCRNLAYYKDDLYAWSFLIQGTLTKSEEDYAADRICYRIEEFFNHDIQKYLATFSDSDIKLIIDYFAQYLAHKNVCDKSITILLKRDSINYRMAAFMICIKNTDLLSAFKIVKHEIASNSLKKKSLFSRVIKKLLSRCVKNYA